MSSAVAQQSSAREPRRQVWHYALILFFIAALSASQMLGARPVLYGFINNVAPAGDAPADVATGANDDWSVLIHRSDWRASVAGALGYGRSSGARLGWVVREGTLLSMPLFAWRRELAVFTDTDYGYALSGLSQDQQATLASRAVVGWFPWWRFVWGWLPLAALAGFIWAELRWQARRREMLGII